MFIVHSPNDQHWMNTEQQLNCSYTLYKKCVAQQQMGNKQQQHQIVTFVTYNMNEKIFPPLMTFFLLLTSSLIYLHLNWNKNIVCVSHSCIHNAQKRISSIHELYAMWKCFDVDFFCVLIIRWSVVWLMTSPQTHDWMTQKCIIITSLLSTILYSYSWSNECFFRQNC